MEKTSETKEKQLSLSSVEEIINAIRKGKPIVLMDDESRENEGDVVVAATSITPEIINFMLKEARGLLCLTLEKEQCQKLNLYLLSDGIYSYDHNTAFTISIDAANGITTGISAKDRVKTILTAISPSATPKSIVKPGHIFPIMARDGGVLCRPGHTEASCDIVKLAGLHPSAVIIEIMNEDGTMARLPELKEFAKKHNLLLGSIADIIEYRLKNETTIKLIDEYNFSCRFGVFKAFLFEDTILGIKHLALVKGTIKKDEPCLVRVQPLDALRDVLANDRWNMNSALEVIAKKNGVLVLIGDNKVYDLSKSFLNLNQVKKTSKNNVNIKSEQNIGTGAQILKYLGVDKIKILGANSRYVALSGYGIEILEIIDYNNN